MLTPKQLEAIPYPMIDLYQRIENFALEDICRRIAKTGVITDSAEYQMLRLKDIGMSTKEIRQTVATVNDLSYQEVNSLFKAATEKSYEFDTRIFRRAGRKAIPFEENKTLQQLLRAQIAQTNSTFYNYTQSMGFAVKTESGVQFKFMAAVYQDALDFAHGQITTGVTDANTAIFTAVRSLADSGIQFVDYASGPRNRVDVAVRRATLTGVGQITGYIAEENANILDTDLVETTAHGGARDGGLGIVNHKNWQGKVYSLSGKSKKYPPLRETTGYGTGMGLKGWNCRHDMFAFIEGLSQRAYTDEQLKNIDPPPFIFQGKDYNAYKATQKQREIETEIKKQKRRLIAYKAAGLENEFTDTSIKLQALRRNYEGFSKAAGLPTQNERLQTLGFGKSISQRAVWANKKNT